MSVSKNSEPTHGIGTITSMEEFEQKVKSGDISQSTADNCLPGIDVNDLRFQVKDDLAENFILYGYEDKFNLFVDLKSKDASGNTISRQHVLTTKLKTRREIINPETAFNLLTKNLGIKKFRLFISKWNPNSFYNKHKLSVESRERSMLRKSGLEYRYIFIQKFSDIIHDEIPSFNGKAALLTDTAIEKGYVKERDSLKGTTMANWLRDHNPAAWGVKAALDICLDHDVFPDQENDLEMAAFASIWFDTRGPFETVEKSMAGLPKFKKFPLDEIEPFMKTEVNHYTHVQRSKNKN
ncbi:MAG: hypothetical protein KZQ64_06255 [gamma proteobacterium symbiont of Bathyaustriella thionipta]|nr:hypothetical protein [gamma proteobacterium symbiont of Bathyaustriella thionipta]MCU7952974.1 hypothetical protein [gamma proteobacterium symbiont of Bathyaustriella thionipta]MCU7957920.1 hypothetical protein [gamma proteobacterium symbiont of Bathyaustriella thionipta]MCU7968570.1 hypothetical protein [gamma proteobacterium symbiont of Bathyaustriella thionipta]